MDAPVVYPPSAWSAVTAVIPLQLPALVGNQLGMAGAHTIRTISAQLQSRVQLTEEFGVRPCRGVWLTGVSLAVFIRSQQLLQQTMAHDSHVVR